MFAAITGRIGVNPDNAQDIAAGLVKRHKRHRARVVDLGQPGQERRIRPRSRFGHGAGVVLQWWVDLVTALNVKIKRIRWQN